MTSVGSSDAKDATTAVQNSSEAILCVRDLTIDFETRRGRVRAVDGVSFDLYPGEALGLVGESGSGKSVTCLSILRMLPEPAGRISGGSIELGGRNLTRLSDGEMRDVRGRQLAMIMQDPNTSLDPLFTIGYQLQETITRDGTKRNGIRDKVASLLSMVRISDPLARMKAYPHQLSGGMRQRVVAAISLASEPMVLLADEPTTALDVTVQLQFLELLEEIQQQRKLAMIFVTHDLSIIARNCHRVAVMYAGRIVEIGPTTDIFERPQHPYTQALLASIPRVGEFPDRLPTIEGQPPDIANLPKGCPFSPRCQYAEAICSEEYPPRRRLSEGHEYDCWLEPSADPLNERRQIPQQDSRIEGVRA